MATTNKLSYFNIASLDLYEHKVYKDLRTHFSKEEALQVIINNSEGNYSQLSESLSQIAEEQDNEGKYIDIVKQFNDKVIPDWNNTLNLKWTK